MEEKICELYGNGCTDGGNFDSHYGYYNMENCAFNTACFWKTFNGQMIDARARDSSGNAFMATYINENSAKTKK